MRAIKGRDTLSEIVVRKWLFAHGWRFRCQYKKVTGHPDIALPKLRALIEVRGCFWHRHGWSVADGEWRQDLECPDVTMPKTNVNFWNAKFLANAARDRRHEAEWAAAGWNVIVIWECELKTAAARDARSACWSRRWMHASRMYRKDSPHHARHDDHQRIHLYGVHDNGKVIFNVL